MDGINRYAQAETKIKMKSRIALIVLFISGILDAKEADLSGKVNRASFRSGYLVGALSTGNFALALNYERFLPMNSSIGGSLGHTVVSKYGFDDYSLAEATIRKFFFGSHQRMAASLSVFGRYSVGFNKETAFAAPVKIGYFWQWSRLFASLEGGLGPGFYTNERLNGYKFEPDVVDAYTNFGFVF
jgi:hypothetical protein